jgi:hypothetical protein
MATPIPLTAGFIVVDTTTAKTFQLPLSTDIVGRSITIKDRTGNAGTNNITIQTQGGDTFQGGSTTYKITQPYGTVTLVSRNSQWLISVGSELIYASSFFTNYIGVSTLSAVNQISAPTLLTSTITFIDIINAQKQILAVSSGTLVLNGQGITGGGGGGGITTAQLVSTVADFQTSLKTQQISTGFVQVSTVNLLDRFTSATNFLTVSSGTLLLNGGFITGSGGSAVSQLVAGSNINLFPAGGTGVVTINNSIDPTGLVSTANLLNLVSTPNLLNHVSTANLLNLVSTGNLWNLLSTGSVLNYVSTANLVNLVSTPNLLNLISTPNLIGLVSTANLLNLASTSYVETEISSFSSALGLQSYVTTPNLVSSVVGLGSAGYVSTLSTVLVVSSQQLFASSIYAWLVGPVTLVLYDI